MPKFNSVFITGASSGFGRGLALHYARAGSTVYAAARRKAQLDALAAEVPASSGGKIVAVELDVADLEALAAAIGSAEKESGGALDLVIANAGINDVSLPTRSFDWRKVSRTLHVNTTAACVTVACALPAMIARGRGQVVAVASIAGYRGLPGGNGAYSGSKAAVHRYFEGLRLDLRGTGVLATTISPGFVKTELTARSRMPMPFLMELDDAIVVMTRAVDRGQARLVYPFPTSLFMRFAGILPGAVYETLLGWFTPKPKIKPETKPETQLDPKPETKPDSKPDPKPEARQA